MRRLSVIISRPLLRARQKWIKTDWRPFGNGVPAFPVSLPACRQAGNPILCYLSLRRVLEITTDSLQIKTGALLQHCAGGGGFMARPLG